MKVNLACGQNKDEGWIGIDIVKTDAVDIVHDLTQYPWPLEDESVETAACSHYVEHIPMEVLDAEGNKTNGLFAFMNELWRVLKVGAEVEIHHPYLKSERAFWDPTHTRFIPAQTWWYFNQEWLQINKLDHYPAKCNFSVDVIVPIGDDPNGFAKNKNAEYQNLYYTIGWNMVSDLAVKLTKIEMPGEKNVETSDS